MTSILLHFVSKRYGIDFLRYKKSANAESCEETIRENGSDVMRFANLRAEFCANAVCRIVSRAVLGAAFGTENGSDAISYTGRERSNSVMAIRERSRP